MNESRKSIPICVDQMEVTYQSKTCLVSRYEDSQGILVRAEHTVFPGITLYYKEYCRTGSTLILQSPGPNILVVEHCLEGQVEFQMDEENYYLTAGDVLLRRTIGAQRQIHFPARTYRGINIHIDMEKTPKCLACILSDVDVEPGKLVRKFGLHENTFHFLRKNEHLSHIFREFYSIPEAVKQGYLKVKVLEVLLFLTGMELPEYDSPKRKLTKHQALVAQNAHRYLAAHMNEHITIGALAKQFQVSQTQLKDSFRLVYGTSVQRYICEQKMKAAAEILKRTDRKIADVAAEFGYANASKFSTAFQRVMGKPPVQYRLENE